MRLPLPGFGKPKRKPGRIGIALSPQGYAIAYCNREGEISFCRRGDEREAFAAELKALVEARDWAHTPCSLVLHYRDYQLLLTEQPPVHGAEMAQAVRWKIKDLLDFPLEEAAVESFLLPDDAYRGQRKMLYAAALRKPVLEELAAPVEAAGLALDCIEIMELALHNLISRIEWVGAAAVVHLDASGGFVNLVEDRAVYLTRALDTGIDKLLANPDASIDQPDPSWEALLLEIQRSRDYYESQMGKGIVTTLYYSPDQVELVSVAEFLAAQLGLHVEPLELARTLPIDDEISLAERAAGTVAIGAAAGPADDADSEPEAKRAAP